VNQRFFGHPESPLFGVYHSAHGTKLGSPRAVVICPPIGQEYIRTHWNLRLLANQIARQGIHVLRFDYHGVGDSAGNVLDLNKIDIWQRNIISAIEQLKTESGAETVMLAGQRFGGLLAGKVAQIRTDVNSVVLWEPVLDGRSYLDDLRQLHREMLDLWVCKMTTVNSDDQEEILGAVFRRELCKDIEKTTLDLANIIQPQLVIETVDTPRELTCCDSSLQKVVFDDRPSSWCDLRELETAYLRPMVNQSTTKLIKEMFERLETFDALKLDGRQLAALEAIC
jgi:alpha/beta superfamily hydrolase